MAYQYTAYQVVRITLNPSPPPTYTYAVWRTVFATKKSGTWAEYTFATVSLASNIAIANNGDDFIAITSGGGASVQLWQSHDQGETWSEEGTPPPGSFYAWNIAGIWFSYTGSQTYYISGDLATWTPKTLPVMDYPSTSNQFCIDESNILHVLSDPNSNECHYTKSSDLDSWSSLEKVIGDIAPSSFYAWSAIACTDGHVIVLTQDEGATDVVWNVSHDNGDTWEGEDSLTSFADTLDANGVGVWINGAYAYFVIRGLLPGGFDDHRIWIYRSADWNGSGAITWSLLRIDVWDEDVACATDALNGKGYAIETYPAVYVFPSITWRGQYRELFPATATVIRTLLPDPRAVGPYRPAAGETVIDTVFSPSFQLGYDRRADAGAYTYFF